MISARLMNWLKLGGFSEGESVSWYLGWLGEAIEYLRGIGRKVDELWMSGIYSKIEGYRGEDMMYYIGLIMGEWEGVMLEKGGRIRELYMDGYNRLKALRNELLLISLN